MLYFRLLFDTVVEFIHDNQMLVILFFLLVLPVLFNTIYILRCDRRRRCDIYNHEKMTKDAIANHNFNKLFEHSDYGRSDFTSTDITKDELKDLTNLVGFEIDILCDLVAKDSTGWTVNKGQGLPEGKYLEEAAKIYQMKAYEHVSGQRLFDVVVEVHRTPCKWVDQNIVYDRYFKHLGLLDMHDFIAYYKYSMNQLHNV